MRIQKRHSWSQFHSRSEAGESLIAVALAAAIAASGFYFYTRTQAAISKVDNKTRNHMAMRTIESSLIDPMIQPLQRFLYDEMVCGDVGGPPSSGRPEFMSAASGGLTKSGYTIEAWGSFALANFETTVNDENSAVASHENYIEMKDFCTTHNFDLYDADRSIKFCVTATPSSTVRSNATHASLPTVVAITMQLRDGKSGEWLNCDDFVTFAQQQTLEAKLNYTFYSADRKLTSLTKSEGFHIVPYPDRKVMFVTRSTYKGGELGGYDGATGICQNEARISKYRGSFVAVISTEARPMLNAIDATGGLYAVNGRKYLSSNNELYTGSLPEPIIYDRYVTIVPVGTQVWTGTNADRTAADDNCSNWTDNDANGVAGLSHETDDRWLNSGTYSCNEEKRLICVRQ